MLLPELPETPELPKPPSRFNDGLPDLLSPKYDLIFKLIFAKRPDLAASFIRAVTLLPAEDCEGLTIIDPHAYPERGDGKLGIMDIRVVVKSKKVINVEMQKEKKKHLRERIVSYMSGMAGDQANSGDDYDSIKRVICILVIGEVLIPEDSAYHHRYTMYDPETRSEFTDLLEVHVLELPKLPVDDDGSDLWGLMKFIDVEDRKELDMIAEKDPEIGKAAARLLEISEDPETRLRVEFDRRWEADQRVERRAALREGREEGVEEGMEKERTMIIELIEKGLSLEDIKRVLSGQQKGGEG